MYRLTLKEFRRLYPFRSHFLALSGGRMHYVDEGAGEPVLMIHGNPTWSFYYRELIRELSPRFRVIAPDHLGCGLSDVPSENKYEYILQSRVNDIENLINSLNIETPLTLIVHDWGGMIGLAYAAAHPQHVARLVVTNTAAFPLPRGKRLPLRLRLARNAGWLSAAAVRGLNLFALGALFMATRKGLPRSVKAGLIAPYDNWRHRLAVLRFVQDIPLCPSDPSHALVAATADRLQALRDVPMLICWALGDFVFDGNYLAEWRRRFPAAEVHTFPNAGHYLLEDAAEAVSLTVRRFLESHPVSGSRHGDAGDTL